MPRLLGTVEQAARVWAVAERLGRVARVGRAYTECLNCVVEISRRGKTVAGKAYTRERRIVLNTALFLPGREADRNSTFLHECAHVIADIRYGRDCGHGWRWRRVMDLMGEPPDTRHEFTYLSAKTHAVVTWVCRNCGEEYYYVRRPRRRIEESCCSRCGPHRGELFAKSRATALQ